MLAQDLITPKRVWINCPSKNQPYYIYHGRKGIAHSVNGIVTIYFVKGLILSMVIDPKYLA